MSQTMKQRCVRRGKKFSVGVLALASKTVRKHVAAVISALSFESPTMSEVKRKWSDFIVSAKEQMCLYRQVIPVTGGGTVTVGLFPTDDCFNYLGIISFR